MVDESASLAALEAKFADDSSDGEEAAEGDGGRVGGGGGGGETGPHADTTVTQQPHEQGVDDEADEGWSSEDDLAYELELADLEDDLEQRGTSVGSDWSGYRPNAQGASRGVSAARALQPKSHELAKLDRKVHTGRMQLLDSVDPGVRLTGAVATSIKTTDRKQTANRARGVDKADRATVEQALDPRTRIILFKMLNRGIFNEINGCVSTGKEANVYHGTNADGKDMAIKVYKTSILVFRDRDAYVTGDRRFSQGYGKGNPRQMVKVWAEKEMRNLSRLRNAGILSPEPILLRSHVLVMEFVGTRGVAAPRLKDAGLSESRLRSAYEELVRIVRKLYQDCRLVHADLSEYNILWEDGHLWIIDVSQAVDLDHPRALDFLRADCSHCNDFFRRNGVAVLTNKELFDFAVDPTITDANIDEVLERMKERASSRPIERTAEQEVAAAVFQQAFIPTRMDEVMHFERDHEDAQAGEDLEDRGVFYQTIMGLKPDMSGPRQQPSILEEGGGVAAPRGATSAANAAAGEAQRRPTGAALVAQQMRDFGKADQRPHESRGAKGSHASEGGFGGPGDGDDDDDDEDEDEEGSESGSDDEYVPSEDDGLTAEERRQRDKDARKAHKKEVKDAAREKRKTKMPKHVKKKKEKAGKKK